MEGTLPPAGGCTRATVELEALCDPPGAFGDALAGPGPRLGGDTCCGLPAGVGEEAGGGAPPEAGEAPGVPLACVVGGKGFGAAVFA